MFLLEKYKTYRDWSSGFVTPGAVHRQFQSGNPADSAPGRFINFAALTLALLSGLAGLFGPQVAAARETQFNAAATTYLNGGSFTCSGCHGDISQSNSLSVTSPSSIKEGVEKLLLSPNGQLTGGNSSFMWRYKVAGKSASGVLRNTSFNAPVDDTGTVSYRYCIADAADKTDASAKRRWRCGTGSATRSNTSPSITSIVPASPMSLSVGQTREVVFTASDAETPDSVSYTLVGSSPGKVNIARLDPGSSASATYAVTGVSPGSGSFTVRVSDGKKSIDTSYSVVVTADNTPPQINSVLPSSQLQLQLNQSADFSLNVVDDSDALSALSFSANAIPASGATVAHTGNGQFSVTALALGETLISVTVTDSDGESSQTVVTLNVVKVPVANNPPVIVSPVADEVIELKVDQSTTIVVKVEDESPESVTIDVKPVTAGVVSVDSQPGGKLVLTGLSAGSTVLQISASDGENFPAVVQIAVVVSVDDQPPVAADDEFVFDFKSASQLLAVLANDSDAESAVLTIALNSNQTSLGGSVEVDSGQISYTPPLLFAQSDSFSYFAVDEAGQRSSPARVIVRPSDFDSDTVFDGEDNCVLLGNADQLDSDGDLIGDVCDADPDGDGELGDINNPFTTGKSLVESVCAECHSVGLLGAPEIGDKDAWAERIAAAPNGIFTLIDSVANGKGEMPAHGALHTARELSQAVLYLTGLEDPAVSTNFNDRDLDGIDDLLDNCLNYANPGQSDIDGDGIGDDCEPDSNGDGRLDYSASLVIFQQTQGANRNGGIVLQSGGNISAVARTRADLPGLSYDWSDSSPQIVQAIGSNANTEVIVIPAGSLAVGSYTVAVTVQGSGIVGQTRSQLIVVETSADIADPDFDGYPASLDSDGASANRMQANPMIAGNENWLISPFELATGRFASELARRSSYASVKAVLSETELNSTAPQFYPGVAPQAEPSLSSSIGIIDIELHELDSAVATLILDLQGNIPQFAGLRIYDPLSGNWNRFVESASETLSSANRFNGSCPPANSANYSAGLAVGQPCVQINLLDGGQNDSDNALDGVVSVVGILGRAVSDEPGPTGPQVVSSNNSKGGGAAGPALTVLLLLCLYYRVCVRRSIA